MVTSSGCGLSALARCAVFAAALAVLAAPARAGLNRWTPFGPGGGEVRSLALDPSDPDTLYAAAGLAGLYKSTDGGSNWAWSGGGLGGWNFRVVAVDPADPDTLYVASGDTDSTAEAVFRSTDGGAHWTQILEIDPEPLGIRKMAVADGVIYVQTFTRVFRSLDAGATWTQVFAGGRLDDIDVDPQSPQTAYLATSSGLLKTTDAGASWQATPTPAEVLSVAVAPSRPSRVYLATSLDLHRSDDAGATWTEGATRPNRIGTLAVDPNDPLTVYSFGATMLVSRDGGQTWRQFERGLPHGGGSVTIFDLAIRPDRPHSLYAGLFRSGVYVTGDARRWRPTPQNGLAARRFSWIKAHPRVPTTLYALGADGLWRSLDRGATWAPFARGVFPLGVNDLVFDARRPGRLQAATSVGVFLSTDGGASWAPLHSPGIAVRNLLTVDDRTLLAGTNSGLFRSTDGGRNWDEVLDAFIPPPDDDHYAGRAILWLRNDPAAPGTVYGLARDVIIHSGGGSEYFIRSTDGGATWQALRYFRVVEIVPGQPRMLFAADGTYAFRSRNAGTTWERLGALPNATDLEVDPNRPGTIYAGTGGTGVYRSTDGGVTWAPVNAGLARFGRRRIVDLEVGVGVAGVPGLVYAVPLEGGLFQARFTGAN